MKAAGAPRVLFLSPYPKEPVHSGVTVRIEQLQRALASRYPFICAYRQGQRRGARQGGSPWIYGTSRWSALCSPELLLRARREARDGELRSQHGLIVANTVLAGLHGAILKRWLGWPLWLDTHNVEWRCLRRYGSKAWPLMWAYERWLLTQCDLVTCVSQPDAEDLVRDFGFDRSRLLMVPNGFDPALYHPLEPEEPLEPQEPGASPRCRLLFFGLLSYRPNQEAVEFLARELRPRLPDRFEILVAGSGAQELAERYPELTFLGFVPDLPELIRGCQAVLAPLRSGGGTRLKIVEAAACGRPVLATTMGAEGLDRAPFGPGLTVLDEAQQMADWICRLPESPPPPLDFQELCRAYAWPKLWGEALGQIRELPELRALHHGLEETVGPEQFVEGAHGG